MFNKILICADGSECAQNAARAGAAIAQRFGAEVLALHVFDLSYAAPGYMGVWAIADDQETFELCMKTQRETAEKGIKPIFEEMGVPYRMLQEIDHAVDGILNVAEREQVDLIVIGSRGLTGIKELFLGSVSQGVLHHAHCPVLIACGAGDLCEESGFQHILLAADGSEGAHKAAIAAVNLCQKFAGTLTVLNAFEPLPSLVNIPDDGSDPVADPAPDLYSRQVLNRVRKDVECTAQETGVTCTFRQERGRAEETILRFAREQGSDLIVMGSRGLGGFKRLLLGSVSNHVAHHAPCPVLIVR
jgi:nucleotide-binding universal stress UspA family protein